MSPMAALSVCFYGNGEDYFAVCRYLDEAHIEIDGVKYAVREVTRGCESKQNQLCPCLKAGHGQRGRIDIFMEQIVFIGRWYE